MFDNIFVCLDGSPLAEKILPLAQGVAKRTGATIALLRVVENNKEILAEESYMRKLAGGFAAQVRFLLSRDPAASIIEELAKNPGAMPAMTTHGRTALAQALLGSVAFRVIKGAKRPVILYCPLDKNTDEPKKVSTLAVALDGSEFSEKIMPFAAEMAKSLAARLLLIQALPLHPPIQPGPDQETIVMLESSYLRQKSAVIKRTHGIAADWEVLHGEPADAICRYLKGMPDTMLAISTHARRGLEQLILGSVAGSCIRHAGVPILIYWPEYYPDPNAGWYL
jgi:nucleotide-binding universal stress UspA family protein